MGSDILLSPYHRGLDSKTSYRKTGKDGIAWIGFAEGVMKGYLRWPLNTVSFFLYANRVEFFMK